MGFISLEDWKDSSWSPLTGIQWLSSVLSHSLFVMLNKKWKITYVSLNSEERGAKLTAIKTNEDMKVLKRGMVAVVVENIIATL